MSENRNKGVDEIFCRSCGEPIKKEAEICPECGVRNKHASPSSSQETTPSNQKTTAGKSSTKHDPSQYDTTVSDTWWYGVAGGTGLWGLVLILSAALGDSFGAFGGFLIFVAWIGLPFAAYFDMQYVRANGEWNPNTVLWVVLLLIWLVNIVAGAVYLYRRHEVLGEP
jgi:hypothetical protein